jgi:hypothetical protein
MSSRSLDAPAERPAARRGGQQSIRLLVFLQYERRDFARFSPAIGYSSKSSTIGGRSSDRSKKGRHP